MGGRGMVSSGTALIVLSTGLLIHAGIRVLELRTVAKASAATYVTPADVWMEVLLAMAMCVLGSIMDDSSKKLRPAHAKAEMATKCLDTVFSCPGFASFSHRGVSLQKLRKSA